MHSRKKIPTRKLREKKFHRLGTIYSDTFSNHCRSCAFVGYAINSLSLSHQHRVKRRRIERKIRIDHRNVYVNMNASEQHKYRVVAFRYTHTHTHRHCTHNRRGRRARNTHTYTRHRSPTPRCERANRRNEQASDGKISFDVKNIYRNWDKASINSISQHTTF